ncbi:MAG: hypothetical protein ACYTGX_03385 [Planctomycetota bacterium]
MGEHHIARGLEGEHLRAFMDAVLTDLRALERMLDEDRFETGVRRIGAEQEMFLVDEGFRPSSSTRGSGRPTARCRCWKRWTTRTSPPSWASSTWS